MQIGSFSLIKELNTSLILNTIRSRKNISRADIAKITGLTAATVTNITAQLIGYNLIKETKFGKSNGGRKPILLEFNHSFYNAVGVVISKHEITVSITDLNSGLIERQRIKISSDITPEEAIDIIIKNAGSIIKKSKNPVLGIGVSMEGLINEENGICVLSFNFGWENIHIRDMIYQKLRLPVYVNNDVKALAMGEKLFGSARNSNDFILLYTGYGIGATLVTNGRIYRGASNYASEIGHTTLDINGPYCSCGNKGCFQALASGESLLKQIKIKGYKKYFDSEHITVDDIIAKADEGIGELRELIEEQAFYIGVGLANIINIFNPSLIIVSGFISRTDEKTKDIILSEIQKRSLKSMQSNVNVVFSKLGVDEKYKGAIGLLISELFDNPENFFQVTYNE